MLCLVQMDVHCFLLTDMLLVCKTTTKKTESRTARVRVLRPPYLVERLVVQELPREPPTLACVYLNEYKVATTAFLLTSPEPKLVKTWADMIRKAQGLYAQVRNGFVSNQIKQNKPKKTNMFCVFKQSFSLFLNLNIHL